MLGLLWPFSVLLILRQDHRKHCVFFLPDILFNSFQTSVAFYSASIIWKGRCLPMSMSRSVLREEKTVTCSRSKKYRLRYRCYLVLEIRRKPKLNFVNICLLDLTELAMKSVDLVGTELCSCSLYTERIDRTIKMFFFFFVRENCSAWGFVVKVYQENTFVISNVGSLVPKIMAF